MTFVVPLVLRALEDEDVTPGIVGFLVVALLAVATWLLIRSMNRRLRKVDFEEAADDGSDAQAEDRKPTTGES